MTETIAPAEAQAAESLHLGIVAWLFLDNFASKDMPGRQRHIQDCVDQILAKVNGAPAAG